MPLKTHRAGVGPPRRNTTNPLLDEPPLGHLQGLILKKLIELGVNAFGYKVLEELTDETGVWIDHSKVYATIRSLVGKDCIEPAGERASPVGGPPIKLYKVRPEGHAALKATLAHYEAVAKRLKR